MNKEPTLFGYDPSPDRRTVSVRWPDGAVLDFTRDLEGKDDCPMCNGSGLAFTSEHGATSASAVSQNTAERMTQSVAVASDPVAVAGRAPVAQSGEIPGLEALRKRMQDGQMNMTLANDPNYWEAIARDALLLAVPLPAAPIADEARLTLRAYDKKVLEVAAAIYDRASYNWHGIECTLRALFAERDAAIAAERGAKS